MMYRNIAIIGAGAVGAYLIWGLTELEDVDFCLVAEGERARRLKEQGVVINDRTYRPAVKTPEEAHGVDLVVVCTKYQGLASAVDMIETLVDDHTVVVSLLNGIDSEEIIGERIGSDHLLYSVMRISSERRDGRIFFIPENVLGISIGEKGTREVTPRVQAFADLCAAANLRCFIKEDILMDQWSKYSMNVIYNLPQAVLGVGFAAFYDSEHVIAIRDRMFQEVKAVANAEGIPLKEQGDWRPACVRKARFSTLQDLDAGRHTEVEMFAGALIRLAAKHGIPVPFTEFCYHAIRTLEQRGDGMFEYDNTKLV